MGQEAQGRVREEAADGPGRAQTRHQAAGGHDRGGVVWKRALACIFLLLCPSVLLTAWWVAVQEEDSLLSFLEDRQRAAWKMRAELQDRQQKIREAQSTVSGFVASSFFVGVLVFLLMLLSLSLPLPPAVKQKALPRADQRAKRVQKLLKRECKNLEKQVEDGADHAERFQASVQTFLDKKRSIGFADEAGRLLNQFLEKAQRPVCSPVSRPPSGGSS